MSEYGKKLVEFCDKMMGCEQQSHKVKIIQVAVKPRPSGRGYKATPQISTEQTASNKIKT